MKLAEIFETRIEEKIDPVIKVGEVQDEAKLASEIGAYVVTPTIEKYVDEFLEHFTDTVRVDTTEIGAWISGYFGSGKSHLATQDSPHLSDWPEQICEERLVLQHLSEALRHGRSRFPAWSGSDRKACSPDGTTSGHAASPCWS